MLGDGVAYRESAADLLECHVNVLSSFREADGFATEFLVHGCDEQLVDLQQTIESRVKLDEVWDFLAEEAVWISRVFVTFACGSTLKMSLRRPRSLQSLMSCRLG